MCPEGANRYMNDRCLLPGTQRRLIRVTRIRTMGRSRRRTKAPDSPHSTRGGTALPTSKRTQGGGEEYHTTLQAYAGRDEGSRALSHIRISLVRF